jgi:protein-tyrosine phosphatase
MRAELYWLDGPWLGRVALAARPRGGDWLPDEMRNWKSAGIEAVLSLLTPEEEAELSLESEAREVTAHGLNYMSFPIPDRQVPRSEEKLSEVLDKATRELVDGKNIVVHCRQGIGRSGLVAACLLVKSGMSPGAAVDKVSAARGISIPETDEQRDFVDQFAAATAK